MKSVHKTALAFVLSGVFICHAATAATCEDEVSKLNQELADHGAAKILDTAKLATTLRSLNQNGRLPGGYITSDEAKKLGWSGKDDETLWGVKPTNGKMIGGDSYRNSALPAAQNWYSADIDVSRGYRSNKRLIYSQSSATKFISPDKYQNFLEVEPCQ
ncbi:MAG: ribonuclease [Scandinavium sp.]|uniref:ribonuclease n=1 Tax=Scandinavium sp. TaxID=2830653 RepID=UPI003F2EB96C